MSDIIYDKRRKERQQDSNAVTVTVLPDGNVISEKKVFHNYSVDISMYGTRIKSDIMIPVNTSIGMEMKLKTLYPKINVFGKVKWIRPVNGNVFEAGIEFVHTSGSEILKLSGYLSWLHEFKMFFPFYA